MKVTTNEHGIIQLEEVVIGIDLKTKDGELMTICMRDSGFEFKYQGKWYFAKEGYVEPIKTSSRGNLLVDQRHEEKPLCAPGPASQNQEMKKRWLECEELIQKIKGTFITQSLAKEIYELQKGGFRLTESRLNDNTSIVVIERQYDFDNYGEPYVFLIRGLLGKELNMR